MKNEEIDKLNKIIENLKKEIEFRDRDISQLKKDYHEILDSSKQLMKQKRILLDKLNDEIKVRIEKEAELNVLREDAEDLPF